MKRIRLTNEEKKLERALLEGGYSSIDEKAIKDIALSIKNRKKDAVLNIRLNQDDLNKIKSKAKKHNVPYQTLISEYLHRLAG